MTTAPPRPPRQQASPSRLPEIPGPGETVVLLWRRLRRMSTALYLLLALAAVSVVATFVPQEPVIPTTVADWRAGTEGPGVDVAAGLDALGLFDIYGSWWFATLVVLLFVSLTGCLIPRVRSFVRQATRPPAPGRNLTRLTHHRVLASPLPPEEAAAAGARALRGRRLRARVLAAQDSPTGHPQAAAERGHAREGGSIAFHLSFYLLAIGAMVGVWFGFESQVNVVEGGSFADTPVGYDRYEPGRFFDQADHDGFTVELDAFAAEYHPGRDTGDGPQSSLIASEFASQINVREGDEVVSQGTVAVNEPFQHGATAIYQIRFGFAPELTVRTEGGTELHADTTNLIESDDLVWTGVAAVERTDVDNQIALDLALLPDATTDGGRLGSASNEPDNPLLAVTLWYGPLGLERNRPPAEFDRDAGTRLDESLLLAPGETDAFEALPLELTFEDLPYWSGFQVAQEPGHGLLLAGAGLLLVALVPSLFAYRRRVWVDAEPDGHGGSRITIAGVARQRADTFAEAWPGLADDLAEAVQGREPGASQEQDRAPRADDDVPDHARPPAEEPR